MKINLLVIMGIRKLADNSDKKSILLGGYKGTLNKSDVFVRQTY